MPLTKRKLRFIEEFCKAPKTTRAELARRAGYAPKNAKTAGHLAMKDPNVLKEIERRTAQKLQKLAGSTLNDDDVITGLLESIEICKSAGPGSWQVQGQQRGWELIGKIRKMFTERIEHGADDQLIALLMEGRKRANRLKEAPFIDAEIRTQ